jgi:uncharacterized protein
MAVEMELARIIINEMQSSQIIVLKEVAGERSFPIVIGTSEAAAIDRRLKGIRAGRPLTHDLLASVIDALGGELESIEINNLQEHTFFARLNIRRGDDVVTIDSRPSDAIALGVATNVKILVADHVLSDAAQ